MLLPTHDKEVRKQVADFFAKKDNTTIEQSKGTIGEHFYFKQADEVLNIIEKEGYHKGLYPSIEEALNSGEGSYKP